MICTFKTQPLVKIMKEAPSYAEKYRQWMEAVIRDAKRCPDGTLRIKADGGKLP